MITTWLFDLDDTLHDKTRSLAACAVALHAEFALPIDRSRFVSRFVIENQIIQPKTQVFAHLATEFSLAPGIQAQLLAHFDESFHSYAQPFPGMLAALQQLKKAGLKLGCVTNGRDFFQRNKIRALGLEPLLDCIVTSGELGIKKPDLRIFEHALQTLGAQPKQTVFCGDSLTADIKPAKQLGMITVWKCGPTDVIAAETDFQLVELAELGRIAQLLD